MGVSPAGGIDERGGITRGGYLRLLQPKNSHTVHFERAHYGPVFGSGMESIVMGDQAVVVSGRIEPGRDEDG